MSGIFVNSVGLCSDRKGNVYIVDSSTYEGFKIQAGTTNVINSWPTHGRPDGCALSTSGDAAFTDFSDGPSGGRLPKWLFGC